MNWLLKTLRKAQDAGTEVELELLGHKSRVGLVEVHEDAVLVYPREFNRQGYVAGSWEKNPYVIPLDKVIYLRTQED